MLCQNGESRPIADRLMLLTYRMLLAAGVVGAASPGDGMWIFTLAELFAMLTSA